MPLVVTKVWIAPGCIVCDACETTCPDVFQVTEDTCIIRPEALNAEFTKPRTETIIEASEECPVEVIKFETIEVDEAPAPPKPAAAPAASAEPATAEAAEPLVAASAPAKTVAAPATNVGKPPGVTDPAIAALLKATTARGGRAGMSKGGTASPPAVKELREQSPDELPPDARFLKKTEAARSQAAGEKTTRRGFISAAGVGWAAFAGSTAVSLGAFQSFMMPKVLEEPDPRVRLGDLGKYVEMPVGGVSEDYKGKGIWIVRLDGEIAALSTVCTHLGCIPNWLESERKFKCPCHGSGFMQNGINFEGPAPRPLERFKIALEDGTVIVDRSKKFQQEKGEWDNPESFLSV